MIEAIHRKPFTVRAVDIDGGGLIHPVTFVEYILEAAGEHAALGGLAVTDLFRKGVTWVLSRFHVEFRRWPKGGQSVTIETWPSGRQPLFAIRDYSVVDEDGPLAVATSSWLIVDLKTRRPTRIEEHLADFPLLDKRALPDPFAALPSLSREDARVEYPIFSSDIDLNRHVTASVYIHRALETVPNEILFHRRPAEIEVNFRGEAFYGDRILSRIERLEGGDAPRFLHRLSRAADDKELTILRTSWPSA
ncbi:MAG: thioesterase [Acidobacteriota bacterium]|nr:thioesterase [Acidobacteriota bacterium]